MLSRLSIRDIVLIERLDIDFARGLAVLTGETGAGKSILLDAFALALGGRQGPRGQQGACGGGHRRTRAGQNQREEGGDGQPSERAAGRAGRMIGGHEDQARRHPPRQQARVADTANRLRERL